jgi:hypothetical protein
LSPFCIFFALGLHQKKPRSSFLGVRGFLLLLPLREAFGK